MVVCRHSLLLSTRSGLWVKVSGRHDLTLYRHPSRQCCKVEAHEATWAKNLFLKEASWADNWSVIARCKIAFAFDSRAEVMELPSVNKAATPRYLY